MQKWFEKGKKNISVMLLTMMACNFFFTMPVLGEQAEKKIVRVGYYPVADYQESHDDGTYSGFGYDYYVQMQKYTGWEYEFVEASYSECYAMLVRGDIDVISGIAKTEEREEQVLFSKATNSGTQSELYTMADDNLYYEDFEGFDGKIVGIVKGTLHDELEEYCITHDFTVETVQYDTMFELEQALADGEVDMMYATNSSGNFETKIVARFNKIPIYYAVTKGRPDLLEEIDEAQQKINDNNPNFYTQLSEKYMINGTSAAATFTKEEFEYIHSGQQVYVIMNTHWAPISWYDEETGEFKGIVKDVLDRVQEYSGLEFVCCTEAEYDEMEAENPEVINHVLGVLADDNSWANNQSVMMTNHIVDSSVVMVTKRSRHQSEINENMKIALPKAFYIGWIMRDNFVEGQVTYYDTVQDCLTAINEGEADAAYVNELVATYYLSMLEYSNLFATANSGYNENLAFAISKDTTAPLLGIIDKSLLCIGADDLDEIVIQNSIAKQELTMRAIYYSSPEIVIVGTIVAILVVGAIVFAIYNANAKKKRMDLELKKEMETNNARTEFFMMISHELRTPLNAIVGYLNLAQEEAGRQGTESEYLLRSRKAATQLTDIAEDMLEYTKIASDSAKLQERTFDIKEVVVGVQQNIDLSAAQKGISFQFTIGDIEHEYVVGDRLRIAQIMQNLLSNAVKFTNPGGRVSANVTQEKMEDGTILFQFTAQDTGVGMTEDFIEKICKPFKQMDKEYSRTHGGMGLGLYLTKYYVNAMHGTLEVSSELGKGSTFVVSLPLKKADVEYILNNEQDLSGIRAIIGGIRDEENKQLKDLLKRLKMKSDLVTSAELFEKRVRSRLGGEYEYALCIIDESIFSENLVEILTELEKPPVIFVMTKDAKQIDLLSADPQIDEVLYKPIFQSVLFDAVMNTFGGYKAETEWEASTHFEGIRAMIVEDNKVNADILMRVLKKANIDAVVCENGLEAVKLFESSEQNAFQVIFMDIQMPVMNGYEATTQIRNSKRQQGSTIPIIAVSANAFAEDMEKSLQVGMNEHLPKPVNGAKLYAAIEKYCVKAGNDL